jgi:hypothetical protein
MKLELELQLKHAIHRDHKNVQDLVSKNKEQIDYHKLILYLISNDNCTDLLHQVIQHGQITSDIWRTANLFNRTEIIKQIANQTTTDHEFAANYAAFNGNVDLLSYFIETYNIYPDHDGFIDAVSNGHYNCVEFLLKYSNKQYVDCQDNLPIIRASSKGHYNIFKLLIQHGACPNAQRDMALCWASCYDHLNIVKELVEQYKANVHTHGDWPISLAIQEKSIQVVSYLMTKYTQDELNDLKKYKLLHLP